VLEGLEAVPETPVDTSATPASGPTPSGVGEWSITPSAEALAKPLRLIPSPSTKQLSVTVRDNGIPVDFTRRRPLGPPSGDGDGAALGGKFDKIP
jgi:hypothetical protein